MPDDRTEETGHLDPAAVPVRSVGALADGSIGFLDWADPAIEGGFSVETLYSGVSAGTELTFVRGSHPFYRRSWDREYGLFVGHQRSSAFPVRALGYMEVARVLESRHADLRAGDVVCMAYGHRTRYSAGPHEFFVALPTDIDPLLGVYVAMLGPIAANALLHAAAVAGPRPDDLGGGVRDRAVVVLGAGAVGLFIAAFALHHGARDVVVVDRNPARRRSARRLGADVFDDSTLDPGEHCKRRWHRRVGDAGADVAFQTRPSGRSLANALRTLRPQGVVIDLAFYTESTTELFLGEEFHHNGLSIVCAQIGRTPGGTAEAWPRRRLADSTVDLLRHRGDVLRQECITGIVPFADAPAALLDLERRRGEHTTLVFGFPGAEKLHPDRPSIRAGRVRR